MHSYTTAQVWSIRVDCHVLDHDGNIVDCACIAAITALMHFRRPDVTVSGSDAIIVTNGPLLERSKHVIHIQHSLSEKPGVPLSVHHTPICISFGFFETGDKLIVDPTQLEEAVMTGQMTIAMNAQKEVCAMSKAGGTPLSPEQIIQCTKIANVKVGELHAQIKKALKDFDEVKRPSQPAMET